MPSSGVDDYRTCLVNVPTNTFSDNKAVNFQYPGQIWGPNDQCQLSFGAFSTFCQVWLHFVFVFKLVLLNEVSKLSKFAWLFLHFEAL